MRTIYHGLITRLLPNEIFVFGSNTQGIHGAGAAKFALDKFGAIYGQATGLQGQSYAIITKDLTKDVHPSISKEQIIEQIEELYNYAKQNPDLKFLIAYSGNGINLNAYTSIEMAEMFDAAMPIPENIVFEQKFHNLIFS